MDYRMKAYLPVAVMLAVASAVWDAYDANADVRAEPLFLGGVSLY
jgi:hypothetical protein